MKIGIDASTWANTRGFGRFTRELVSAMLQQPSSHEFVLFFDDESPQNLNARVVRINPHRRVTEAAIADGSRSAGDLLRFSLAAARARLDVMFYPAVYSWFPCPPGLPNLLTLHDAIAEHFPQMVFPQMRARAFWNVKVRLACFQASRFLTVSQAAKAEIVAYMKLDSNLIDLTTEAPKPGFRPLQPVARGDTVRSEIRARFNLAGPSRYFCYVGGFAPHKNVLGLVNAFAALDAAAGADVHLLLVGDRASQGFSSNIGELDRMIAKHPGLAGRVHFTGFVSDALLADIYATSIALVMPSFAEGFGLPAIEAMACGAPVIASAQGSLAEVVGSAGLLIDPHQPAQIAAAMAQVAASPELASDLAARSVARAALFSWDEAARLALSALERCVEPQRR